MSSPAVTFISSSDLEERLETWRSIANLFRDRHERALIHGERQMAIAVNFGSNAIEECIEDIERVIAAARGEPIEKDDSESGDNWKDDLLS